MVEISPRVELCNGTISFETLILKNSSLQFEEPISKSAHCNSFAIGHDSLYTTPSPPLPMTFSSFMHSKMALLSGRPIMFVDGQHQRIAICRAIGALEQILPYVISQLKGSVQRYTSRLQLM